MTKSEFVELVQEVGGYETKAAAEKAVKAFTDAITAALVKKESVSLVGFGTFSTVDVPEKTGKIPGKDATYTKPAHTAPKFKIGKTLKDAVSGA
jgi:DNA-binding protein HU-beta